MCYDEYQKRGSFGEKQEPLRKEDGNGSVPYPGKRAEKTERGEGKMGKMIIRCPFCGSSYEVEPEMAGQSLECPGCGHSFTAKNPNLKPCPDCFKLISRRADRCPHCGAVLLESANFPRSGAPGPVRHEISQEKEVMVCHPSLLNYLFPILLGIVTIPILIGFLILLYIGIQVYCTSYRITTLRIVARTGFIAKIQNEIWIKDMRGANLSQSIWQRILGTGNISIGTAATAGAEICMNGIANPQEVVDTINSLR